MPMRWSCDGPHSCVENIHGAYLDYTACLDGAANDCPETPTPTPTQTSPVTPTPSSSYTTPSGQWYKELP
jgi:hypothetical protein